MGCSGHDPYDSWFRLRYFEQKLDFSPDMVILVLNSDNVGWFKRHPKPFEFDVPKDFGAINTSRTFRLGAFLRNTSSLFEVYYKGFLKNSSIEDESQEQDLTSENVAEVSLMLSPELQSCLAAYKGRYGDFIVLSILDEPSFNEELTAHCQANGIRCWVDPIMVPMNMINGAGHLNQQGNKALGEALYNAFANVKLHKNHDKDCDDDDKIVISASRYK